MSKKNKKKRTAGDVIRTIIMFAALAVFLFSAAQLAKIFLEYKKGTDEYNRVREYVTTTEPEEETQEPLEGEEMPKPLFPLMWRLILPLRLNTTLPGFWPMPPIRSMPVPQTNICGNSPAPLWPTIWPAWNTLPETVTTSIPAVM